MPLLTSSFHANIKSVKTKTKTNKKNIPNPSEAELKWIPKHIEALAIIVNRQTAMLFSIIHLPKKNPPNL